MKDKFLADDSGGNGLARKPFVHAVFMHLYQTNRGLHVKNDAARVVAMLDELFDQIGISYMSLMKKASLKHRYSVEIFCSTIG